MVRMEIQLTERQAEGLKSLAAARGVSVAELIRESVDRLLASDPAIELEETGHREIAVAGTCESGVSDLGIRHGDDLAEAYAD